MTIEIHGFCDEQFRPLEAVFRANFADGLELGASLALTHRGKTVVDLWGGFADAERTRPWQQDTIVLVASTTKVTMMISALIAIDRGLLNLNAPVARYWPEFAQGGKAAVTVRDALTHQAGVPGFEVPLTKVEYCDWAAATARVAAERHWFGGERRVCYHALTYGFLIGELIRRVDGRQPAQFFREEIAERVGADFQIGLSSKSDLARKAMPRYPNEAAPLEGIEAKVMSSVEPHDLSWERFSADDPASNGNANGRSIARIGAIVANGGELDGVRLLSASVIQLAGKEQAYGQCPYIGWVRLGLGFGLDSKEFPAPTPTSMHWGGYGGSSVVIDPRARVSFGYAPNNFIVPPPDLTQIDLEEMDPRLRRFFPVLRGLLPTL